MRITQLMPHEVLQIKEHLVDYYHAIDFKEAIDKPEVFIQDIVNTMSENPYVFFLVAHKGQGLLGFTHFYIDRNLIGETYAYVEMDWVNPDIRDSLKGARVHKELLNAGLELAERCGVTRINTVVKTDKLLKSRKKMGFKEAETKLVFNGTVADFRNHNPLFMGYYKTGEET